MKIKIMLFSILLFVFNINAQSLNEEDVENTNGISFYEGTDHTLVVYNNDLYSSRIKVPTINKKIIDNIKESTITGGVLSLVTFDGELYTTTVSYILKNGYEVKIKDEIEPLYKENIEKVYKVDFSRDNYVLDLEGILYKKENNQWKKIEIADVVDFTQAKDGSLFVMTTNDIIIYTFSNIENDYFMNNYESKVPSKVDKILIPEIKENFISLSTENSIHYNGYEVVLKYDQKKVSLVYRNNNFYWNDYIKPEFNLEYIETQYNPDLDIGNYVIVNSMQFDVPVLALEKNKIETTKGIMNFKNPQIEIISLFPKNELERQKFNTIISLENKQGKVIEKRQSGLINIIE